MISPRKGKSSVPAAAEVDASGIKPVSPRAQPAPKNYDDIVRVLADIKIRNQKAKEIIKRSPPEDVEEFASTNLLVEATVQRLLTQVKKYHLSFFLNFISQYLLHRIPQKCSLRSQRQMRYNRQ